jgi:RHS repeat-associated protein
MCSDCAIGSVGVRNERTATCPRGELLRGRVAGATSYDAYGNVFGTTGTGITPLGYDGQYTNSDTGLIYLRAREYDPTTGQFLSVDPEMAVTALPYGYATDDPLDAADATGECADAVAARVLGYSKPSPCAARLEGPSSRFSVATSGTPTVSWGLEFSGKFIAELKAEGYYFTHVTFTSVARVNGTVIKGPGSKLVSASYTYHGSIGPKIIGNKRLRKGDLIALKVDATGEATNFKGGSREFSAEASAYCIVE